jgi:hypothetical protein
MPYVGVTQVVAARQLVLREPVFERRWLRKAIDIPKIPRIYEVLDQPQLARRKLPFWCVRGRFWCLRGTHKAETIIECKAVNVQ